MRRRSLTHRLAAQLDREAFARLVLLASREHEHAGCGHADCATHEPCRLHEAIEASTRKISEEGAALLAEYRRRHDC